nr:hypothetical protein [Tanacetum cinerariifolium]
MIRKQVGDLSSHSTKCTSPALTQKVFANMRRVGKGFFGVETPLFEGMIVEQQVAEGADEVHDEGVPATSIVAEGDVNAANDEVPTTVEEPSIPSPTPPTPPPQPSQDIPVSIYTLLRNLNPLHIQTHTHLLSHYKPQHQLHSFSHSTRSFKYALTVNPNIYASWIKQFWTSVAVKKVNDVIRLQALVDKKKVVITEASIRDGLHLDDAEGDVNAANDEVPTTVEEPSIPSPTPPTPPPQPSQDIPSTS